MKQKLIMISAASVLVLIGLMLARSARPAWAQGTPKAVSPTAAAGPMAALLSGKLYPPTLKSEQIDPTYTLIVLADLQGKTSAYATKGETFTVGGETFLVTYAVPLSVSPNRPPQPKVETTAELNLINLRAIQAMGGIQPIGAVPKYDSTGTSGENGVSGETPKENK